MESDLGKFPQTLQEAITYFADPERAHAWAVRLRWPDGVITCPRCAHDQHSYISTRRLWFCKGCKKQFTVKVATIFEDSPLGMDKWMMGIWLITNCKNGISSYELAADLGISQKSAWHLLHRIREAMSSGSFEKKMTGEVEADETYIGGKVRNMHQLKKIRKYLAGDIARGGTVGKALVMGLLERNTKQVRATVLPELRKARTDEHVRENVEPGSKLYTDEANHYDNMPEYAREFVTHAEAYVRGAVHTNTLENFWSLLKRSLAGTYISVEPFHLQAYVNEQAYRFNNRKATPAERFADVMANVYGKRLTWNEVTGKTGESPTPVEEW
jgi:transposase-like protein